MSNFHTIMKKIELGAPPDRRYYWARYRTFPNLNESMAPCDLRRMAGWRMVDPKDERFASRFGKDVGGDDFTPGRIRLNSEGRVTIGDLVLMETSIENYKRIRQESIDNANLPMLRLKEGGHIPSQYLAQEEGVQPVLETKPDDLPTRSHAPAVAAPAAE